MGDLNDTLLCIVIIFVILLFFGLGLNYTDIKEIKHTSVLVNGGNDEIYVYMYGYHGGISLELDTSNINEVEYNCTNEVRITKWCDPLQCRSPNLQLRGYGSCYFKYPVTIRKYRFWK